MDALQSQKFRAKMNSTYYSFTHKNKFKLANKTLNFKLILKILT